MRRLIGPVILIVLGLFFLMNNLVVDFPIGELMRRGWPFLLIAIGIIQLFAVPFHIARGRNGVLVGPVVLIVIGILFALQQIWGISFRDTWPVMLVGIGLALLLQNLVAPLGYFRRFGGRG
jgi:Domain of unknown function (DUF5668)